jgi:two-component system OmpR family sensor kinase
VITAGPRRWTIRTRLIVTLATVVAFVIVVSAVASTLAVRHFLEDRISTRLASSAERVRASLVGLHGLAVDSSTIEDMARAESTPVVIDVGGRPELLANTNPDTAAMILATDLSDGKPQTVDGYPGLLAIRLDVRGTGLTIRDGTRTITPDGVIIAVDASDDLATVQTMVLVNTAGVLVSISLLVVLTVLIVGRGVRPLRTMSAQARAFAEGDRSQRLPVPHDDPDITRLATAVNQAFDAQQEAEARLRAFVADASHELRTPLTTATGWIELYLQGGLTDPEQRDNAMLRVETQLGRMRLLIDELALLARLDRARPLDADPLDLTALATEVVEDARVINPDRDFTIRTFGPAALLGDAPKLRQVLLNLVGNAVQHTPPGTAVEVTVIPAGTDEGAAASDQHTLLVADHGPGIPLHDQPHIFTRFWRGDVSRNRNTGGSGLGLSIVSSIVAVHGGSSQVTSEVGQGTTIRILLPVLSSPPPS